MERNYSEYVPLERNGCKNGIITNAAGGISEKLNVGD